MKYEIGTKVEVIGNNSYHRFSIGETVEIIQSWDSGGSDQGPYYEAINKNGETWYVNNSETKQLEEN